MGTVPVPCALCMDFRKTKVNKKITKKRPRCGNFKDAPWPHGDELKRAPMEPKGEENDYHSHAGKRIAHNEATRNKKSRRVKGQNRRQDNYAKASKAMPRARIAQHEWRVKLF